MVARINNRFLAVDQMLLMQFELIKELSRAFVRTVARKVRQIQLIDQPGRG